MCSIAFEILLVYILLVYLFYLKKTCLKIYVYTKIVFLLCVQAYIFNKY